MPRACRPYRAQTKGKVERPIRYLRESSGLRRLRFGGGKRDAAGRALLAALGLVALTEQDARGYALRSRCDLVCDGVAALELVHADGSKQPVEVSCREARDLYCEAYEAAEQAGIAFSSITLQPQPKLVEIVRRSREHTPWMAAQRARRTWRLRRWPLPATRTRMGACSASR